MINTSSAMPSNNLVQPIREKRRLGLLLCTVSSVLTLTFMVFLAAQFVSFGQDDVVANDIEALQNFTTAAGSSE